MDRSHENCSKVSVIEKENVTVKSEDENDLEQVIRIFEVSLNDFRVELSSLGASITRIQLKTNEDDTPNYDDVVLGFDSLHEMYVTQNPTYYGVCTGRVTNRIQHGLFRTQTNGKVYNVAINNEPNHLHGGRFGFSRKIWQVDVHAHDQDSVQFSYLSDDGDEGYPGKVKVTAVYTLNPTPSGQSVKLCLMLTAELLDDTPSPVNLTQHTYFNLAGHDDTNGILNHTLRLNCDAYTPTNEFSIPTREVTALDQDLTMDWRHQRTLRDALIQFGTEKVGRTSEQIQNELEQRESPLSPEIQPYGFDHNYVVRTSSSDVNNELSVVAVLKCANRRLTVRSTQPGVQLYTANYLDGVLPAQMKDTNNDKMNGKKRTYHRWQGICLETQHFPDSILVDRNVHPDFARGQCPILTPTSRHYQQTIEYTFENYIPTVNSDAMASTAGFQGTDSDGNQYNSVEEMWYAQGVTKSSSSSWYDRAASYYDENCPTTIDGVLGGYATISELDIEGSIEFIRELELVRPEITAWTKTESAMCTANRVKRRACECGAGLGRISKGILLNILNGIEQCDLIESSATLLGAAPDYFGETLVTKCRFYCVGLQDWQPIPQTYSMIWIQWVLSYLTDDDIIRFFRRCGDSLVDDGIIILKENMCSGGGGGGNGRNGDTNDDDEEVGEMMIVDFEVDVEDASVTRSLRYWKYLIHQSGLQIIHEKIQDSFPDNIYPVPMLALEKASSTTLS